jgi:hypothetical protein
VVLNPSPAPPLCAGRAGWPAIAEGTPEAAAAITVGPLLYTTLGTKCAPIPVVVVAVMLPCWCAAKNACGPCASGAWWLVVLVKAGPSPPSPSRLPTGSAIAFRLSL